jgi:hypothetical protein
MLQDLGALQKWRMQRLQRPPSWKQTCVNISRAMYYFCVHFVYASIVSTAAWTLMPIRDASVPANYWILVACKLSFVVPVGAAIAKL